MCNTKFGILENNTADTWNIKTGKLAMPEDDETDTRFVSGTGYKAVFDSRGKYLGLKIPSRAKYAGFYEDGVIT